MPKLTEREREGFEHILKSDLKAINQRFISQIKDFWGIARIKVLEQKGWDKLISEKDRLEKQREEIKERLHQIEEILNSDKLRAEQVIELGGKSNEYGRCEGANFYGIPVTSQFEYEIVEYIKKNIDLEVPAKILRDVCESSIRALVMAGTFEEARGAYEKFYSLDFRKHGVDIPPRLDDICADKNSMLYAQQSLQQIEKGKPDIKLIEGQEQIVAAEKRGYERALDDLGVLHGEDARKFNEYIESPDHSSTPESRALIEKARRLARESPI